MELITFESDTFRQVMEKLDRIEQQFKNPAPNPETTYLDTEDLCRMLNISKRTAQNYRDRGIIEYTQIGAKIHYRLCDVHKMMEKHRVSINAK